VLLNRQLYLSNIQGFVLTGKAQAFLNSNYRIPRGTLTLNYHILQVLCDSEREQDGDGVSDLLGYLNIRAAKNERVGKRLQPGRLSKRNGAIRGRVEISTFLWFEEFCANCRRRLVPLHSTKHICASARLIQPTIGRNVWPLLH
jgi:hypothetical protein